LGKALSFLLTLCSNLYHAFISAVAWSLIWFFAFFGSTVVIDVLDNEAAAVTTSALTITAAVLSGHLAKLVSYFIGCDTDFRHLFIRDKRGDKAQRNFFRFFASLGALLAAAFLLYQGIAEAVKTKNIVATKFFVYSLSFWCVILCIFLAQLVFSWPDPVPAKIEE